MPAALYLKLAAVNFGATITDSQDLATVRGAGLAALRLAPALVGHLRQALAPDVQVETLYAGASEAVARLRPADAGAGARRYPPVPRNAHENTWKKAFDAWVGGLAPASGEAELTREAQGFLARHGPRSPMLRRNEPYPLDPIVRTFAARLRPDPGKELRRRLPGEIAAFLRRAHPDDWPWRRLTVAHAVCREDEAERLDGVLALLDSRLRREQLGALTLPVPDEAPARRVPAKEAVCEVTRILPADPEANRSYELRSRSVADRRKTGIEQKRRFYDEQLARVAETAEALAAEIAPGGVFGEDVAARVRDAGGRLRVRPAWLQADDVGFAASFPDIAGGGPDGLPVSVRRKLAVVRLDGNGFGRLTAARASRADGFQAYRRFSRYLEVEGGMLLADLLDWMVGRQGMWTEAEASEDAPRRLRFETLLWGGDEMCFVLPAWEAWDFVGRLLASLRYWREPEAERGGPLTFKLSLVLAQERTPVRDLLRAAEELERLAKADATAVQVMTLEGIDRADFDPEAARVAEVKEPLGRDGKAWSIPGDTWEETTKAARALLRKAGKSQLHRQLRAAACDGLVAPPGEEEVKAAAKAVDGLVERLGRLSEAEARVLKGPGLALGWQRWPFLPLLQLLDLADFITAGEAA